MYMRELVKTSLVAEVKNGGVEYYKEYCDYYTGRVIAREKIVSSTMLKDYESYSVKHKKENSNLLRLFFDMLNDSSFDISQFRNEFLREHRYLQGEFAQVMFHLLELFNSSDFGTDARNEFNKTMGTVFMKAWNQKYSPQHDEELPDDVFLTPPDER